MYSSRSFQTNRFRPALVAALACLVACALMVALPSQNAFAANSLKASGQVSSSAVTAQAYNVTAGSKAALSVQARVQGLGWLNPVASGKLAGTKTTKTVRALRLSLTGMKNVTGNISYCTYDKGLGWGSVVSNGKSTGRVSRPVQAVKICLTGKVASQYELKYRVYIRGKGWQSWTKGRGIAGTAKRSAKAINAIQVKIVSKATNKTQLNGIDISSWQAGLNPANVDADFVIVKATEGTAYTNPYFKKWANATLSSGKLLGAYHFINAGSSSTPSKNYAYYRKQADYFVKVVGNYVGKCVLFLDWENRDGSDILSQTPAAAKVFLDRVYKKTGVKPLVYMSKSVCRNYNWKNVAKTYGLWCAQYAYKYQNKGTGYLTAPWTDTYGYGAWTSPTVYQYTSCGKISGYSGSLDLDLFYGTVSAWKKLQSKS